MTSTPRNRGREQPSRFADGAASLPGQPVAPGGIGDLARYAAAFAYFLLACPEIRGIRSIILFGSVAQGRAGPSSDVDVLIDTPLPPSRARALRSSLERRKEAFLISQEGLAYKAQGVFNDLELTVGNLDGWEEMRSSLSAGAVVLFGPFTTRFAPEGLRHHLLIVWEGKGANRGALLNKLYGYGIQGKRYKGAIDRLSGEKIGKAAALIPMEHARAFMGILEHYGISYKVIEVFR
ncbi:MAG: nucleotidyltransferase domain-containing protein [Candidatus Aenigmarchaeota archaeon]|nr:nucleotidyltransferase domain-containing protein [Candidatus Aenigmarchaeota archaeon]